MNPNAPAESAMPTLKKRVLPVSALAMVAAAAVAVAFDAAKAAEQVPVRYGTDPASNSELPQYLSYTDNDAPGRSGVIEHIVEQGETVYALGRIYDVKPGAIIERNELRAPYGLQIGQLVLIPVEAADEVRSINASADVRRFESIDTPATRVSDQRFALDSVYEVRQGDTLYNISRRFGLSVADLAAANGLREPYSISINQRLVIPGAARQQPRQVQQMARSRTIEQRPNPRALDEQIIAETMSPRSLPELGANSPFAWPVRGPVLQHFGDPLEAGTRSDGINIAAPIGAPVRATADGEVVYRGNELDGYGNLLLVKHENGWVSAYAHTDAILVRKGDYVRQGQVIAKVGRSGTVDRPQLHFQLRRNLQPTDPIVAMQGELDGAALTAASIR